MGKKGEPKSVQAGLNKEPVTMLRKQRDYKIPGNMDRQQRTQKNNNKIKLEQDINKIISVLKGKKATGKQTLYILNRILLPRIEYKIRHCHLSTE